MKNNINISLSIFAIWCIIFSKDGMTAFGAGMLFVVLMSFGGAVCWLIGDRKIEFNGFIQPLIYESSISYGLLIILGVIKEFISFGNIFGIYAGKADFLTKKFQEPHIGFILTGIILAIILIATNGSNKLINSWWIIIPAIALLYPIKIRSLPTIINLIISLIVVIFLMNSVKEQLKFALVPRGLKGLPIDLISLGLIYLALSFI